MLQGIKKTDLDPERVMEGRITDNVDIESVKVSCRFPNIYFKSAGEPD